MLFPFQVIHGVMIVPNVCHDCAESCDFVPYLCHDCTVFMITVDTLVDLFLLWQGRLIYGLFSLADPLMLLDAIVSLIVTHFIVVSACYMFRSRFVNTFTFITNGFVKNIEVSISC